MRIRLILLLLGKVAVTVMGVREKVVKLMLDKLYLNLVIFYIIV